MRISEQTQCRRGALLALAGVCVAALVSAAPVPGRAGASADVWKERTRGLQRHDGLLVTWTDARAGKLLLELPAPVC